jgi:hypothetical protein
MGKYEPLREYLGRQASSQMRLTFAQIEQILGAGLPPSARQYRPWWGNEVAPGRVQARAWLDAGWRVETVRPAEGWVVFERIEGG